MFGCACPVLLCTGPPPQNDIGSPVEGGIVEGVGTLGGALLNLGDAGLLIGQGLSPPPAFTDAETGSGLVFIIEVWFK